MGCHRRLDKAFENVPVLPLDSRCRYVLFSDCHRGNGTHNDNFLKNQHLYFAALRHYYQHGYTYIELGDGDELWENRKMEQIKEIHSNIFWLLSLFYREKRLYMIYGNHDMVKKYASFTKKKCESYFCTANQKDEPLFPGIRFYSGIILTRSGAAGNRALHDHAQRSLYLTHGHQASLLNSTLWPINRFLVRFVWKPLEQIGILDPTSAAKNYTTKQRSERLLNAWAVDRDRILITGHTHRPMLSPSTDSHYINTGSCVHPRCVTCIELCGEKLKLVKWYTETRENGDLYVARDELSQIPFSQVYSTIDD